MIDDEKKCRLFLINGHTYEGKRVPSTNEREGWINFLDEQLDSIVQIREQHIVEIKEVF